MKIKENYMKKILLYCVVVSAIQFTAVAFSESNDPRLLLGLDIVRHGDRAPLKGFSNVFDGIWEKKEMGMLTEKGVKESLQFGRELYSYYVEQQNLLSPNIDPNNVYISSTDTPRTRDTAIAITKGLFFEKPKSIIIHTLACVEKQCTAFNQYKDSEDKISSIQKKLLPNKLKTNLLDSAQHMDRYYNTNFSSSGIFSVAKVGGALVVGELHNKPLPKYITPRRAEDLMTAYKQRYMYLWSIPARNCNHSRWIIAQIKEAFNSKIKNLSPIKLKLMVMHDINLLPILRFFDFPVNSKPGYNADIRFELFEIKSKYFVRMSYNGTLVKLCSDDFCTIEDFYRTIDRQTDKHCFNYNMDYDYLKYIGIN